MVSLAKVVANRRNASMSTGPRSLAGKAKIRNNAFKHGLAADLCQGASDDVDYLTEVLSGADCKDRGLASIIAESQVQLVRVRDVRAGLICQALDQISKNPTDIEAIEILFNELIRVDRYERRAISRRKRAIRTWKCR